MDHPSIITIMTLPSQTTFIFIQPIIIILLLVMYISYTTYYISFCTFILLLTNIVHVLLSLGKDYIFGLVRNILSLPTQQNTLQAIKQHDRFIVMCGLQYIYITTPADFSAEWLAAEQSSSAPQQSPDVAQRSKLW